MRIKSATVSAWGSSADVRIVLNTALELPDLPDNRDPAALKKREDLRRAIEKRIEEALQGLEIP